LRLDRLGSANWLLENETIWTHGDFSLSPPAQFHGNARSKDGTLDYLLGNLGAL